MQTTVLHGAHREEERVGVPLADVVVADGARRKVALPQTVESTTFTFAGQILSKP